MGYSRTGIPIEGMLRARADLDDRELRDIGLTCDNYDNYADWPELMAQNFGGLYP